MTDQEAKNFVSDIFEKITKASTKNDLIKIEKESFESKYLMDTETFPKIDFNISSDEIDDLIVNNVIDKNYNLKPIPENSTPLTKLLYSIIWKNGDLKKLKHIAKGIHRDDLSITEQESSFVFTPDTPSESVNTNAEVTKKAERPVVEILDKPSTSLGDDFDVEW